MGSARQELLNHVIVPGEQQQRRFLRDCIGGGTQRTSKATRGGGRVLKTDREFFNAAASWQPTLSTIQTIASPGLRPNPRPDHRAMEDVDS